MRAVRCAVLALAVVSAPIGAKKNEPPPIPTGYDDPGSAPENPLPKVVAKLRTTLNDPYSIRDFTICAPTKIDAFYADEWVHAYWNVKVTLNTKNSLGGYIGSSLFDVAFVNGEATEVRQFKGMDLLTADQNSKIVGFARECPRVPDAEIQKLLAG